MQSVVMHGHFYQPPREDPWLGEVAKEAGAAPFHDWNERICHECYEPFSAARLFDATGAPGAAVNLYEWVSFDVGTTLASWLESHAPAVYAAIRHADRESAARLGGRGNAMAMPYHHVILPLASRREKETEVRWGLADFRRRFGRDADGVWLPETAADEETLVVLAEAGVRFTVLAPAQVENPPVDGSPLAFDAGGGRTLALFVYDGPLAADVAFGALLKDGRDLARRLTPVAATGARATSAKLLSLATDGETFGHHHKFAEMALAQSVAMLRERDDVRIENFSSALDRYSPSEDVQFVEPSSWSCPHGIERWRSNCGCRLLAGTTQAWRRPLRSALNWLGRELDSRLDSAGPALFADWPAARESFGSVAALPADARRSFAAERLLQDADTAAADRTLHALRSRMGMFISCAWFFDDVAGVEPALMLRLAAHAIDLAGDADLERRFIERLAHAKSNDPVERDAARVYRTRILAARQRPPA